MTNYIYVVTLNGGDPCFASHDLQACVRFSIAADEQVLCRPRIYRLTPDQQPRDERYERHVDLRDLFDFKTEETATTEAARLFDSWGRP